MSSNSIQQLASLCSALCGCYAEDLPGRNGERVVQARQLMLAVAEKTEMDLAEAAAAAGVEHHFASAVLSDACRRIRSDASFARSYRHACAKMSQMLAQGDDSTVDGFYTEADEKRIQQACVEATRFMRSFSQPTADGSVRRPVRDGVGYYPFPTTLP